MADPPVGQTCENCVFWIARTCRRSLPGSDGRTLELIPEGPGRYWRTCNEGDWCAYWNLWPTGLTGGSGPAGGGSTVTMGDSSGAPADSVGSDGDWHVSVDFAGVGTATWFHKESGTWVEGVTFATSP